MGKVLVLVFSLFLLLACNENNYPEGGPASDGSYAFKSYVIGLKSYAYVNPMMYVPLGKGPFPATTLGGDYLGGANSITWIAERLVSHGFIVLLIDANENDTCSWERAHAGALKTLLGENTRSSSPLFGQLNHKKINFMGYSKAGGGALLAAAEPGNQAALVTSIMPRNPDCDFELTGVGVTSSSLILAGSADTVAPPDDNALVFYDNIPPVLLNIYREVDGMEHRNFLNNGDNHNIISANVVSWLKQMFYDDPEGMSYIIGSQFMQDKADGVYSLDYTEWYDY